MAGMVTLSLLTRFFCSFSFVDMKIALGFNILSSNAYLVFLLQQADLCVEHSYPHDHMIFLLHNRRALQMAPDLILVSSCVPLGGIQG